MSILAWLLLAALCVICCGYFNSRKADLWGLKGALAGFAAFVVLWWILPILWGLLKLVFFLAVVAVIAVIFYGAFRVLSKHA